MSSDGANDSGSGANANRQSTSVSSWGCSTALICMVGSLCQVQMMVASYKLK